MKKFIFFALIAVIGATACAPKKTEGTKLAQNTPAYKLAKDLMAVLPIFDPDKNAVLVTAKKFTVTAGDVVEVIQGTMGNNAAQLAQGNAENLKTAIAQAAVQIGERRLLMAEAEAAKIVVSPEELNKAMASQYEQAGGEAKFLEMLKTNNVDIAFVKKTIGEDQTIRRFLEEKILKTIPVSEDELQKAYAEDKTVNVRHILLMTQGKPESEIPAIRKKAEDILARAKKGEDFAALAKEFNEDGGSKATDGLYENVVRGQMVKEFDEAAFSVPVGQISDIVKTEYGLHILKIESRVKETEPFEKVKATLETSLKQKKQSDVYLKFMNEIKSKAKFTEVKF